MVLFQLYKNQKIQIDNKSSYFQSMSFKKH